MRQDNSRPVDEVDKMAVFLPVKMTPELKQLIEDAASAEGMSQTGWLVSLAAEKLNRPDLAFVPRKKSDRPRVPSTNGKNGHRKRAS